VTDTVPPVSPPPPPPGKVLAVDPGERRIGFAITDPERKFAFPLTQLERTTPERDAVKVRELVREERVVLLVVGLPIRAGGEEGASADRARALGAWLAGVTGLPVVYSDESYTTRLAEKKTLGCRPDPRPKESPPRRRRRSGNSGDLAGSGLPG